MEAAELSPFLHTVESTVSVYASVEGDASAASIVAFTLSALEQSPSWLGRNDLARAIDAARSIDVAGIAWFGRASGGLSVPLIDPPRHDVAEIAPIPRLLPVVETMHRSVWHVAVVVDSSTLEVQFFEFPENGEVAAHTVAVADADPATIAAVVLEHLPSPAEVLVVAVEAGIRAAVVDRLDTALPPSVAVYAVEPDSDLSTEVVKAVADHSATDLVHALRTFRFMGTHGAVTEGISETANALSEGRVTKLFASPSAEGAQLFAGAAAREISSVSSPRMFRVRASDALLRSAILQGVMVQIIPEHLADGPTEGVGATLTSP